MRVSTRHTLFRIYAMFFIVLVPFVVVYSLGYNFDWATGRLTRNLFLNVDTVPRGATLSLGAARDYRTPTSLRISSRVPQTLSVESEGYHREEFTVWTDLEDNTTAYLQDLTLLPTSPSDIESLPRGREFVTFLPARRFLATQSNLFYLYTYSPNSLSSPVPVTTQVERERIETGQFTRLGLQSYYNADSSLLLYLDPTLSAWRLEPLRETVPGAVDIIPLPSNRYLVLDEAGNLYLWDLALESVQFVDSGYQGVARVPETESVWLLRGLDLLRLNTERATYADLIQAPELFVFATLLGDTNPDPIDLHIARVYRGLTIHTGDSLHFASDSTPGVTSLISTDTPHVTTDTNAVFYVSATGEIQLYNLLYNTQKTLGYVDVEDLDSLHLYFDPDLSRLLVYTGSPEQQVRALWVDPNNISTHILAHSDVTWVDSRRCQLSTRTRAQVCIAGDTLIKYQNTAR